MKKRLSLLMAVLLFAGVVLGIQHAIPADAADDQPSDAAAVVTKEMDFTFTQRELAGSYEAQKTVDILGSGSSADISGAGAALQGSTLAITGEGVYRLRGEFTGLLIRISTGDKAKVQLVLDGVTIANAQGPCIYVESADKVFLTVPEGSSATLTDGASYAFTDGDTNVDAAIFSRADLCINGAGALTVTGQNQHGVVSKDDLVITGLTLTVNAAATALDGKDCVKVSGAALALTAGSNGMRSDNAEDASRGFVYLENCRANITSGSDGIQAQTVLRCTGADLTITSGGGSANSLRSADGSWKGLKSGGDMLLEGGTYAISSRDDCIHSNSSIFITDGVYRLSSGDDGVHADTNLTISGGDIDVEKSYEGLEASKLVISGGAIRITASDDGLNAAGGADSSGMGRRFGKGRFSNGVGEIEISGGYTVINASGDGVDSNGSILVSGGVTLVSGPTSSGNAAFDYDGSATITGGVLIATGAAGMAQNFSKAENQGAILVTFGPKSSGESIALTDANGLALVAFTPQNAYQCAVITAPGIQQGQTYSLITGCAVEGADDNGFAQNAATTGGTLIDQITMTDLLYGSGGFGMRNMPGGGPGGGGNRRGW